ncbi:MAG: CotH kinase family protein [Bacteroidales bacterium]
MEENIIGVPKGKYLILILLIFIGPIRGFGQILISEFQGLNTSTIRDSDFQSYSDWLELYNSGPSETDVSGYWLTDDLLQPDQWKIPSGHLIPSGGTLLIWADGRDTGLHAGFKLSGSGEAIGLFDPVGAVVDTVVYPKQGSDLSTGRASSTGRWVVFTNPTPGTLNPDSGFDGISGEPLISIKGGFYSHPVDLEMGPPSPGGVVRYTLDGSEPDTISPIWENNLLLSVTTILRARVFEDGWIPGNTVTNSYFISEQGHDLPVVSISIDPDQLWDPQTGIYVNYTEDWERPCGVELFSASGEPEISFNAGLKIFGGTSRSSAQKSLSINARGRYGEEFIHYPLLPGRENDLYGSFILRNGANDWNGDWRGTMFRDALIHTIVENQMDLDYQSYSPVVVYLNGEYWGILNLRDKHNEDYCEILYGADPDKVDIIKHNEVVSGNRERYDEMMDFFENNDLNSNETYGEAASMIDTKELINYLITEIYSCNIDWPANNHRLWSPRTEEGKWRWMLFDTEFGFNGFQWAPVTTNMFTKVLDPDIDDYVNKGLKAPWATRVFIKMTQNEQFRNEFISRYLSHIYTTYDPERVYRIVDSLSGRLENEMPRHIARWGSEGGIYDMNVWRQNVQGMKDFARDRPPHAIAHLMETFQIQEKNRVKLELECREGATMVLNGIPLKDPVFSADFFRGNPVTINLDPHPGFLFKSWTLIGSAHLEEEYIQKGDEWKYLDDGSDQGTGWTGTDFADQSWKTGSAKFGYGEGNEQTVVSYGTDPDNRHITTYLRKMFDVEDRDAISLLDLKILRDDGAIVYLNGIEAARSNMTSRSVNYQTPSLQSVTGADESSYFEFSIDPELLVNGRNTLAVELHQASASSTDLGFDLELTGIGKEEATELLVDTMSLRMILDGDTKFVALMERQELDIKLVFNEVLASNTSGTVDDFGEEEDWIELYNTGDKAVDMAGLYLTDTLTDPAMWEIPTGYPGSTTVEGKGFILLWADGESGQGPLHLGFKLSREGEKIGLFQKIGDEMVLIDSVSFPPLEADVSLARVPDGTGPWMKFGEPTPGTYNFFTGEEFPEETVNVLTLFPNPTKGSFTIRLPADCIPTGSYIPEVTVFSMTGQVILQRSCPEGEEIVLDLSSRENGLYMVRIFTGTRSLTGQILLVK